MQDWMFEIGGDPLSPAMMPEPWLEGIAQGVWAPVADTPLEPWLDPRFEASAPRGALVSAAAIAWMIEDDAPLSITTTAAAVETTAGSLQRRATPV